MHLPEKPNVLAEKIIETKNYFPELNESAIEKLIAYCRWIWETNQKINLVSRKDVANLYERHLWYSLAGIKFWNPIEGSSAIDVGTGGGFPGIPLAIAFPNVSFTLLDSTRKKIEAIDNILNTLNIVNVRTVWQRAEEHPEKYDCVWGRGVSSPPEFYCLVAHLLIHKNAPVYYLTGGSKENVEEWKKTRLRIKVQNLHPILPTTFFETKFLLTLRPK
jgi:16S rRNA (guanine527-N7)-methyltransferase